MKKLFPGFYLPTEEDFSRLWNECMFVFDASMLLNIYRYSAETQKTFLTILERFKDRIWLPNQAVFEFSKNRSNVIEDQLKAYTDVEKMLDDIYLALEKQLGTFKRHSSISIAEILAPVRSGLDGAKGALATNKEGHQDLSAADPVGDKLEDLIEGRVGAPFSKEKLVSIYNDGVLRYQLQ
jgi:PIN domain-containing protein